MAKPRDHKAEYARRKARGLARGLSVAQARGHARASEAPLKAKPQTAKPDPRLESALKRIRNGESLGKAAKAEGVSQELLRRFLNSGDISAKFESRRWTITADNRPRRVPVISSGRISELTVPGFDPASEAGKHWNAVGRFIRTNDIQFLAPFRGQGVSDTKGRFIPFETDPNVLYRLASAGIPAFHEVYEIIQ